MLYDPNWKPAETEIKLEPWQEILLKAADIIKQHGWTRGDLTKKGRFCAVGAIILAEGNHPGEGKGQIQEPITPAGIIANGKLLAYINNLSNGLTSYRRSSIEEWNDDGCRSSKAARKTMKDAACAD